MDADMKLQKSLPPLVKGKIHGYLKLVIDEVIWSTKNCDEISVFVSWWGETSRSQFRPVDITKGIIRSQQDTTEIYAIRTNIKLFEEYVRNCDSTEIVVVSDKTNLILGTSQITDLLEVLNCKPYYRYVPIVTPYGDKIGEIHVSMKLEHAIRSPNTQANSKTHEAGQAFGDTLSPTISTCINQNSVRSDACCAYRNVKSKESETYKSILKSRRPEFQKPADKFNHLVTDKLVAEIVARAQKLRGVLMKETCKDNTLSSSYGSIDNCTHSECSIEDEVKLPDHFCDDKFFDEGEHPNTLKSIYLNSNLPDFAHNLSNVYCTETKCADSDVMLERKLHIYSGDVNQFVPVTYVTINIESLTLTPAGFRRVKSSSLSDNNDAILSATYFIQYDMMFNDVNETGKMYMKENKSVRIRSKKQTKEGIYFNHNSTYKIAKPELRTERLMTFNLFIRHFNRKLFIELGSAIFKLDLIKCEHRKMTKHLNILSKGMKVGELTVIIQLHSDSSYLKRQYNEMQYLSRSKPTSEAQPHSKQVCPLSTNKVNRSATTNSNLGYKDTRRNNTKHIDDGIVGTKNQENKTEDKVLLHGLIYVAEGQGLSELNTYLVCRAFWREDKAESQVCSNTRNPFYQFSQVVPLVYDNNLLERVKNNFIIIEVYSKNNNTDNLLGLTKLPVHSLYVAFNDPHALSDLLLSKYPVVSVDEWVTIIDPVTNQSCGQLLALVALGTSEQIAFLETSRGLRNADTTTQSTYPLFPDNSETCCNPDLLSNVLSLESRECQTDISTVKGFEFNNRSTGEIPSSFRHETAHNRRVGPVESLTVTKTNIDQSVQTDSFSPEKRLTHAQVYMCMNQLNANNSDDSDHTSAQQKFQLTTDTYRSVGVGAEYSDEINQQSSSAENNAMTGLQTTRRTDNEPMNFAGSHTTFRAAVEIESALHLPKVEKIDGTVEPSTYVSFQTTKSDTAKCQKTYLVTNVFPQSCNPKWNWKCHTKLPIELLFHDEKRLIFKIWRILDTNPTTNINLERDIVIGFSAIDLSILMNGFPIISGWFHIMDFTGKCNGQIKVCIKPLDNISLLGKSVTTFNSEGPSTCSVSQFSSAPLSNPEMLSANIEGTASNYTFPSVVQRDEKSVYSENQSYDSVTGAGFEDVSMSFLSLSLKNKLTELDEITLRLRSRLQEVTNADFEDLENEFDLNEQNSDTENNDRKSLGSVIPIAAQEQKNKMCPTANEHKKLSHNEDQALFKETTIHGCSLAATVNCNKTVDYETMYINSSKVWNSYGRRDVSGDTCQAPMQSEDSMQHTTRLDNTVTDYPERGTRTHINYLLDKLSLQFPVKSHFTIKPGPTTNTTNDHDRELTARTIPTQTNDDVQEYCTRNTEGRVTDDPISEGISTGGNFPETRIRLQTVPDLHHLNTSSEDGTIEQLDNQYSKVFTSCVINGLDEIHNAVSTSAPVENTQYFKSTSYGLSENIDGCVDATLLCNISGNQVLMSNDTDSTTTLSAEEAVEKSIDSETVEKCDSISSETFVLVSSRQAPDGGNPVEDNLVPMLVQRSNEVQDSSSSTCN